MTYWSLLSRINLIYVLISLQIIIQNIEILKKNNKIASSDDTDEDDCL